MNRRSFNRTLATLAGVAALPEFLRGEPRANSSNSSATVDTHAHIFQRGLKLASSVRYVPDYDATLADYLRQLDAHAVSKGVLVQPSFLGTDNSYLVAALKQQPERLRGVVVVDPAIAAAELADLAAAGAVGIRLNLIGAKLPDLSAAPWPTLIAQLLKLNWLVEIQREARDLPQVVGPLVAAGLNVVVDHFGRLDPAQGVDDPGFRYLLKTAATRRVWLKLSGAYRNGPDGRGDAIAQAAIPLVREAFGAERLLWGSDWPHTQFERVASYGAVRAQFDGWIKDPMERALILGATPLKLYHFSTPATLTFLDGTRPTGAARSA